ncbi:sugar phosphate nucleotidyltransferase, partial [Escherichia coli]
MSDVPLIAVVMAGGTGSRLWPLSREHYPKQFLQLSGENTLLQSTLLRLSPLSCETPLVITNEQHRFVVAEQLRQIDQLRDNIILE